MVTCATELNSNNDRRSNDLDWKKEHHVDVAYDGRRCLFANSKQSRCGRCLEKMLLANCVEYSMCTQSAAYVEGAISCSFVFVFRFATGMSGSTWHLFHT